jgi:aspartate oxidase
MNGVLTAAQSALHIQDSKDLFMKDTMMSGGGLCDETLVRKLVQESSASIDWIEQQGVPLRSVSQCGGHSKPRTHRIAPDSTGRTIPVGWGIMSALQKKVEEANITLFLSSSVMKLFTSLDQVTGVLLEDNKLVEADSVILTTGGYAGKPKDKENAVLKEFAPKVTHLSTTNGPWATGDGIRLGLEIDAAIRDMVS